MKSSQEVSIRQVEGVNADLSSVGCYLSIDGRLYDVITPLGTLGPDAAIKVPNSGELRLIIKNMGGDDQFFGSVAISLEELPQEPCRIWLPLFDSLNGDLLHSIPVNPDPPRLLLAIGDPSPLSPVPEMTERSSLYEYELEDPVKEAKPSDSRLSTLQHQLEIMTWKLKVEESLHKEDVETLKNSYQQSSEEWTRSSQHHVLLIQDLTSQVGSLQKLYSQEKKQTEILNSSLTTLKDAFETYRNSSIEREKGLNEVIESKDREIISLHTELNATLSSFRKAETELTAVTASQQQLMSQLDVSAVTEMQEALDLAVEQLADSEIRRKQLQDELMKESLRRREVQEPPQDQLKPYLLAEIETLHSQIHSLEVELAEYQDHEGHLGQEIQKRLQLETELHSSTSALNQMKDTVLTLTQEHDHTKSQLHEYVESMRNLQEKYDDLRIKDSILKTEMGRIVSEFEEYRRQIPEGDVVDVVLGRYFGEKGVTGNLQRIGDGVYTLNGRKFTVMMKGGSLGVRVGSGMLPLDGFLKLYMPMEVRQLDLGNRSRSVEVFKSHRRVSTLPDPLRQKTSIDEADWSTNNTSQADLMRPVPELDFENSMEVGNRPMRTPSPKRKLQSSSSFLHSKPTNKTPKTPSRISATRKSTEKVSSKKAPFR